MRSILIAVLLFLIALPASAQIDTWRAAASQGDALACLRLSQAFYKGSLVDPDRDSAAYFMQRTLLTDDPAVLKKAAKALQFGLGADKNEAAGAGCLRKAASLGDAEAMLELSEAFRFGMGVEKRDDSADFYLNRVADLGDPDGQYLVGTRYLQDAFDPAKYTKGLNLLKKAAEQGHVPANWRLAEVFNERNTGTESDKYYSQIKAYSFAEKAAAGAMPEALLFCARARLAGAGTTRSDSLAVVYTRRAADSLQYLPAFLDLGDLYWDGKVTGQKEPLLALQAWRHVKNHDRANADQRGRAELGIHQVDQFIKQMQNIAFQAGGWVPAGVYEYYLRE
jgi:TPR repeat protein